MKRCLRADNSRLAALIEHQFTNMWQTDRQTLQEWTDGHRVTAHTVLADRRIEQLNSRLLSALANKHSLGNLLSTCEWVNSVRSTEFKVVGSTHTHIAATHVVWVWACLPIYLLTYLLTWHVRFHSVQYSRVSFNSVRSGFSTAI